MDRKKAIQALAPELNENEDERILASITACVGLLGDGWGVFSNHNVTKERVLSWIEKQKVQKSAKIAPNQFDGITYGMQGHSTIKPAELNEDERIRKRIINILGNNTDAHEEGWAVYADEIAWLKKQKEQKPAEWSEEDLQHKSWILECLADGKRTMPQYAADFHAAYNWLKSLGPQLKQEWSKEDEETLACAISVFEGFAESKNVSVPPASAKRYLKRLKSFRPQPQRKDTYYDIIHNILASLKDVDFMQITPEHRVSLLNDIRVKCKNADECAAILDEPHWKPSKEQIEALKYFIRSWGESGTMNPQDTTLCAANSLLIDLQKLL